MQKNGRLKQIYNKRIFWEAKMVNILGFDVGGVNIKAAFLKLIDSKEKLLKISSIYYPMWLNNPNEFPKILETIVKELCGDEHIDLIGITLTAEVSDAYYTKKEGVYHILNAFKRTFPNIPQEVIGTNNTFLSIDLALENYLTVASANWVATALFIGKKFPNCILIDIGSTTTDIIPITNGFPSTSGKTDLERLLSGELIYTGSLRSTIPSIVHKVPIHGSLCPISFEKFALIADVHLILDHISEQQYTCDTADYRQKTKNDAFARLARIICADIDILSESELLNIAKYIYQNQLDQIREGIQQILSNRVELTLSTPIVTTGLGHNFLGRKVAEQTGFHQIFDLAEELGSDFALASPAGALTFLLAEIYGV